MQLGEILGIDSLYIQTRDDIWQELGRCAKVESDYKAYRHGEPYTVRIDLVPNHPTSVQRIEQVLRSSEIHDYRVGTSKLHAVLREYTGFGYQHFDQIGSPMMTLYLIIVDETITDNRSIKGALQMIRYVVELIGSHPNHRQMFINELVKTKKAGGTTFEYATVSFSVEQAEAILDDSWEESQRR